MGMAEWIRACSADEVPDGLTYAAECGSRRLVLVRDGDAVYAADRICTHADADLSTGFVVPGANPGVRCPLHLSVFDMQTGIPLNPPAEEKLRTYRTKIDDGVVYVEV